MMSGSGMTQSADELDKMLAESQGQMPSYLNVNVNSNRRKNHDTSLRSPRIVFDRPSSNISRSEETVYKRAVNRGSFVF